jgi:dTMP kinase
VGAVATGGLEPDCVLVLDVDLATAARRLDRPLDKLENRGDEFRARLRAGYLAEAARDPDRIAVIDAAAEPEVVAGRLRAVLGQRFPDAR